MTTNCGLRIADCGVPKSEIPNPKSQIPLAVVALSGGMDSCVTAAIAAQRNRLALLHVSYGQRTARRERRAFDEIAAFYRVPGELRLIADAGYLARIGGSSLTDPAIHVPAARQPLDCGLRIADCGMKNRNGSPRRHDQLNEVTGANPKSEIRNPTSEISNPTSEIRNPAVPNTYVPFRNTHILSIAVSWAEVIGAASVCLGAVEQDSSGYPDCRAAYFEAFQRLIDAGTKPETAIRVDTPVIHMTKADIVRKGVELGAPLHLTWSCYQNEDLACGECESCLLRLRGFHSAGVPDPIPYRKSVTSGQ